MTSTLRDLVQRLRETAQQHPAYGQGAAVLKNCFDHLSAIARIEEANHELGERITIDWTVTDLSGRRWIVRDDKLIEIEPGPPAEIV